MRPKLVLAIVALVLVAGCPRPPAPLPPPVAMVAVLPPGNITGDVLLVAGGSLVEKYALRSARVTVPDLLEIAARDLLRAHGVPLVGAEAVTMALAAGPTGNAGDAIVALANAKIDGAALRLDVWRWEPDTGTQPAFVIVGLEATLIDVASRRTLWHWRPAQRPIPTPGAVTLGVAYEIAARAAVAEILESWKSVNGRHQ